MNRPSVLDGGRVEGRDSTNLESYIIVDYRSRWALRSATSRTPPELIVVFRYGHRRAFLVCTHERHDP